MPTSSTVLPLSSSSRPMPSGSLLKGMVVVADTDINQGLARLAGSRITAGA